MLNVNEIVSNFSFFKWRYLVKELTVQDAPLRLISFMGDVAGMLSPILLLDYFFLLLSGGFVNYASFKVASSIVNILIIFCEIM